MDPYQSLAAILLAACPAGHSDVRLTAELDEGWAQLDLRCTTESGDEFISPLEGGIRGEIYENLDAIRSDMAVKSGGKKWRNCVFIINDRKLDMQVSY